MNSEEKKLWELYKRTGRSELQEKIVIKYLNLVHYIANKLVSFSSPGLDKDDLYSAGIIGLLEAIERFNPDKNIEFKSYAGLRIKGSIIDEIRRFDWVPRSVRKKAKMLDATIHKLFSELHRLPSDDEIAEELDLSIEEYYNLTDNLGPLYIQSLDSNFTTSKGDDSLNYSEILPDNDNIEYEEKKEILKQKLISSIQKLPEKERLVISLYYYENLNLKEIGKVLEVSESRISQIHSSAVNKLRTMLQRKINEEEV
ncbi:MAG: FliA/WhiG family RNA polymerase sigma factor [Candidatus Cloacimonetes bacterium]|jgi:RNA polymerase sigma factor for flagellar operon FliA|nr:FliA/WhiG family RNA polymerase sigma factor [Candidatus Cloacimonadota bacterium]MDD4156283.1 FliA/WhiG family RNA polymerase sigma factor [Candidatus Cloacimonadota bacterium]